MVSVPHNGTRTLVAWLRISARDQRLPGGRWWHFGNTPDLLMKRNIHAHIPIRNPLDVARSWAQRKKTGEVLRNMVARYDHMFAYMAEKPNSFTLYRVEDLPRLAGTGEHPGVPDASPKITEFQDAVRREVIAPHRDFFLRFYPSEELGDAP